MENKFMIGNETIREIVSGEQYSVRPGAEGYYAGDCGDEYEIVIAHNGEEWTIQARTFFKDGKAETEDVISSSQYFDMIPQILERFCDAEEAA